MVKLKTKCGRGSVKLRPVKATQCDPVSNYSKTPLNHGKKWFGMNITVTVIFQSILNLLFVYIVIFAIGRSDNYCHSHHGWNSCNTKNRGQAISLGGLNPGSKLCLNTRQSIFWASVSSSICILDHMKPEPFPVLKSCPSLMVEYEYLLRCIC